jgi:hypothetical protein
MLTGGKIVAVLVGISDPEVGSRFYRSLSVKFLFKELPGA